MSDKWEACPRCGSNKVVTYGKGSIVILFIILGSFFCWIGLFVGLFMIIGITFMLGTLLAIAFKPFNQCRSCYNKWTPGEGETLGK
jgi:hypothetical protein